MTRSFLYPNALAIMGSRSLPTFSLAKQKEPLMKSLALLVLAAALMVLWLPASEACSTQGESQVVVLGNSDVLAMVRAKIPSEVIVARIKSSRCHFDTFPSVLAELKYRGVPDSVLLAMVEFPAGAATVPVQKEKKAPVSGTKPPDNIGVLAQEALTNDSVVKLVKAELSEELIVGMINLQPGNYRLGADDVLALKKQAVSDKIIAAMLRKNEAVKSGRSSDVAPNSASGFPTEMGVYVKKGNEWIEIQPEIVNWKTGGVLKSIASLGVVKGDVNGHLDRKQSPNRVSSPLEFVIIAPEGVAVSEYQLLKLHENSNNREFRTVTGGVFHVKGGATRDLVPFEGKKVASRTFSIALSGLHVGEYGFLPPSGFTHASGGSIGKMYTFTFVE